jgi:hypothetical protein
MNTGKISVALIVLLLLSSPLLSQNECERSVKKIKKRVSLYFLFSSNKKGDNYILVFERNLNTDLKREDCIFSGLKLHKSRKKKLLVHFCDERRHGPGRRDPSKLVDCSELEKDFFSLSEEKVEFFFILTKKRAFRLPLKLFAYCESGTFYLKYPDEPADKGKWSEITPPEILELEY